MRTCVRCGAAYEDDGLVCLLDGAETVESETGSHTDVDPTDAGLPGRTTLAAARVEAGQIDDPGLRERLMRAVRLAVEADVETSPTDARAKRRHAALDVATEIEAVLRRRLAKQTSQPEIRDAWLAMVGAAEPEAGEAAARRRGRPALRVYLESGRLPSLAVMGGWLRPAWRVPPPELADFIQLALGVPRGLEEDVFLAGELRNVLAHAADYETDPTLRLGPAEGLVLRVEGPACVELEVPSETLAWLEWLAPSVLARRAAGTPRRPAPR